MENWKKSRNWKKLDNLEKVEKLDKLKKLERKKNLPKIKLRKQIERTQKSVCYCVTFRYSVKPFAGPRGCTALKWFLKSSEHLVDKTSLLRPPYSSRLIVP